MVCTDGTPGAGGQLLRGVGVRTLCLRNVRGTISCCGNQHKSTIARGTSPQGVRSGKGCGGSSWRASVLAGSVPAAVGTGTAAAGGEAAYMGGYPRQAAGMEPQKGPSKS